MHHESMHYEYMHDDAHAYLHHAYMHRIPSRLPTSGWPTGRQSWGRQFWIHHSSGLPTLILYWFFSFSWMKQCFEGSKASTRSISQVLHQSNSCIGTIRQSQGGSYVKSFKLSQQIVGRVLHGRKYQLMTFDTIQIILRISDLSKFFGKILVYGI